MGPWITTGCPGSYFSPGVVELHPSASACRYTSSTQAGWQLGYFRLESYATYINWRNNTISYSSSSWFLLLRHFMCDPHLHFCCLSPSVEAPATKFTEESYLMSEYIVIFFMTPKGNTQGTLSCDWFHKIPSFSTFKQEWLHKRKLQTGSK